MTDIDKVLAKLNPKTAAMFKQASTIEEEYLKTPSIGLNMALGGGLRYGQIHTLWGSRSAGKSMVCLGLAAQAQSEGKSVAWVDVEKNYSPNWAARHGVDNDKMFVTSVASMVEVADAGVELIQGGIDLLIIDSSSALLPQSYFDDGEIKSLAGTNQIGTFAKNMTSMFNMFNSVNDNTCIVNISQVRNKINTYGATKSLTGGEAIEFLSSSIIKLWATTNEKDQIMGKIAKGDLLLERPVGRPVTWTITKSRSGGMGTSKSYDMYFSGDHVGIDSIGETADMGVEYGIIKKGGAWFTINDKQYQGRPKVVKALKEDPELFKAVVADIEKISR